MLSLFASGETACVCIQYITADGNFATIFIFIVCMSTYSSKHDPTLLSSVGYFVLSKLVVPTITTVPSWWSHVTGLLWGGQRVTGGFSKGKAELWCFLWGLPNEQTVEQTVGLSLFWDVLTLISCDVIVIADISMSYSWATIHQAAAFISGCYRFVPLKGNNCYFGVADTLSIP